MPRTSKSELGCLTLLLLWALFGAAIQFFGKWSSSGLGDDEGGGPFAAIGLVGLILFFVLFGIVRLAEWIGSRRQVNRRGFPVEPKPPGGVA